MGRYVTHNQSTTVDLNWCSRCGGALKLIDGTDPDTALEIGAWEETYRCEDCDATGIYRVDDETHSSSSSGVAL